MSLHIIDETTFFFHSFLLGILITFIYDGLLILRRVFSHNSIAVCFEDIVFWIGCAIGVFKMLTEENNGILRWFTVLGATLGMLLYKKTISTIVISIMSTIISYINKLTLIILRIIVKPAKILLKCIFRFFKSFAKKIRKIRKYIKIRLTTGAKLLKITLCKQKTSGD